MSEFGARFHEAEMLHMAAAIAEANQPRDAADGPSSELTPERCLEKMRSSSSQKERWRYALHYAHLAERGNVPDKTDAIMNVAGPLLEMIEQHDQHSTVEAERGARKLWDLGVRGDDFRTAVGRCLARAEGMLVPLQAALAITDEASNEHMTLGAGLRRYQSLATTMRGYLDESWATSLAPAAAAAPVASLQPAPAPSRSGGFPLWVLVIPVLLLVAGGAFYLLKGGAMTAAEGPPVASATTAAGTTASAAITPTPSAATTPTPSAKAKESPKAKKTK